MLVGKDVGPLSEEWEKLCSWLNRHFGPNEGCHKRFMHKARFWAPWRSFLKVEKNVSSAYLWEEGRGESPNRRMATRNTSVVRVFHNIDNVFLIFSFTKILYKLKWCLWNLQIQPWPWMKNIEHSFSKNSKIHALQNTCNQIQSILCALSFATITKLYISKRTK